MLESDRGETGNESIGPRRVASVLGRGSKVFETGLETTEGNLVGGANLRQSLKFLLWEISY